MNHAQLLQQIELKVNSGIDMPKINAMVVKLSERPDVAQFVKVANDAYRAGSPIVDDWVYDNVVLKALTIADPGHLYLQQVEPEPEAVFGKTVELPERMLSTNKAYSHDEIKKWVLDVQASGKKFGLSDRDIWFRVTPKLDGYAAYDDGERIYTRGNGRQGTDITRVLERGMTVVSSQRGLRNGEIVVAKEWFQNELAEQYENSRNVIAAVIKEGELDEDIKLAIAAQAIVFQPFHALNGWLMLGDELLQKLEEVWELNSRTCPYDTDGLVIEAYNDDIKRDMGSTNHHHRWQIAFKKNSEFHDIEVTGLQWQTAKTGRITPVVLLKPTKVSGVTISKATGHHAGNVLKQGIDTGAIVKVCRSGQVIPYIESVVRKAPFVALPVACGSCGSPTKKEGDNLMCSNTTDCPAQIENTLEYFFKTIGTCDGFGPKVIEAICKQGYNTLSAIYQMDQRDFEDCGLGAGISSNLCEQLNRSEQIEIEDWRFLAAFSIPLVGRGGCEKLLSHHLINEVFSLTIDDVVQIDGFAETTAQSLIKSLARIKDEFDFLAPRFKLKSTKASLTEKSPITGKTIVFTGSMEKGSRGDMEKHAKSLGAKVSSSVSSKTDYLVCGANVGASKTEAAKKHGVRVLSEMDYLQLLELV